jgi:pimeloyl-ACP methyl ester carboxylesterase
MKPIVLIHGLIGSLNNPKILRAFEARRVHTPDLLGYGIVAARRTSWTLQDQADHVAAFIRAAEQGPVHVVGHSAGGAVAVLLALRHRTLVDSITSVAGNFTLADAFWSLKFARMPLHEVQIQLATYRANPAAWLGRAGVPATQWTLAVAKASLDHQPATTLQIQSQAVVGATEHASFLDGVRQILDEGVPLHLIAGSRSSSGWGVPDWVRQRAASDVELPNAGHLMMLEDRVAFARAVVSPLD